MSNPFALSKDLQIQVSEACGSKIYEIRNILARPYDAIDYIMSQPIGWNKPLQKGLNGQKFEDKRHIFPADIAAIADLGTRLTGEPFTHPNQVITNYTRLYNDPFNDYLNHYWWPHVDHGYNGIIYLNDYIGSGTNLFDPVIPRIPRGKEHIQPWNAKQDWTLVRTVWAEFNKLVLFDGARFYHSMAINDKTWFKRHRLNMVFFFGNK